MDVDSHDDYEVFLNYGGINVKLGFIAHLYDVLKSEGLNPFLDKKSLVKECSATKSIDEALERAKVYVAVVTKGYAESSWCLGEQVTIMRSGKPVIPVFYDLKPADLRLVEDADDGPFAAGFEKHRYPHRHQERADPEELQEWADALDSLADITGFLFRSADVKGDEVELKYKVVDAVKKSMVELALTRESKELDGSDDSDG